MSTGCVGGNRFVRALKPNTQTSLLGKKGAQEWEKCSGCWSGSWRGEQISSLFSSFSGSECLASLRLFHQQREFVFLHRWVRNDRCGGSWRRFEADPWFVFCHCSSLVTIAWANCVVLMLLKGGRFPGVWRWLCKCSRGCHRRCLLGKWFVIRGHNSIQLLSHVLGQDPEEEYRSVSKHRLLGSEVYF